MQYSWKFYFFASEQVISPSRVQWSVYLPLVMNKYWIFIKNDLLTFGRFRKKNFFQIMRFSFRSYIIYQSILVCSYQSIYLSNYPVLFVSIYLSIYLSI